MEQWFTEWENKNIKVLWKTKGTIDSIKSKYQKIDIVEFADFGRSLILDGVIQTTLGDEFIYHEMLTHVPLNSHPCPHTVLVVGGGDGGIIREVIKHPVKRVDLVEIDGDVITMSKKYLPELAGKMDDKRVSINIADALDFIKNKKDFYDCVLVDSPDPLGSAVGLFAHEFYQDIFAALRTDGLLAAQTGSPMFSSQLIKGVNSSIKAIFPISGFYWCNVPTYSIGPWSFIFASKKYYSTDNVNRIDPQDLRYYTPDIHRASFALPGYFARLLLEK